MSGLVNFMNGGTGRVLRVILGVVIIALGLQYVGGTGGTIIAVIGLVPIVMGVWGHCLLELFQGSKQSVS